MSRIEEYVMSLSPEALNALNKDGCTPLMDAILKHDMILTKALIKAGADLEVKSKYNICGYEINETALMIASRLYKNEAPVLLLNAGANIEARDNHLQTALIHCVESNNKSNALEVLINRGADVNVRCDNFNKTNKGYTALIVACAIEYDEGLETVKRLIKAGADLEIKDDNGNTALMWAVKKCNLETLKHLVKAGADVNTQNNNGETAKSVAMDKNTALLEVLLLSPVVSTSACCVIC